jgi:hypothetical protein
MSYIEFLMVIANLCQFSVSTSVGAGISSQEISANCQIKMVKCFEATKKTRPDHIAIRDCILDGRTK